MKINPYIFLILLSTIIASVSQILLKRSAQSHHASFVGEYLNPYVIGGYGLLVITTLINVYAYSKGVELKNGAVIESTGLIFVTVLSRIFFRESVSIRKMAGILLILVGVLVFYIQ